MKRLSKQQYINKNINAKKFVSLEQLEFLENVIFPKFFNTFNMKYRKIWQSNIYNLLARNNLNFDNEENYLKSDNSKKNCAIVNSILYCLPNLGKIDLDYLVEQFLIFTINNKIKIICIENKLVPVYIEIIEILNYSFRIDELLKKYPRNFGNHYGTKYRSSSYRNLLDIQLKILRDRLNSTFFTIENEYEIEKTQIQINFIEKCETEDYRNLPEILNYVNIYLGFDNKLFRLTEIQKKSFNQLCNFFNGIKTSKEEILNSLAIYMRIKSNVKNEDIFNHKELSESIINILIFFFQDKIKEIKTNKKRSFNYSHENIKKDYQIKTYIDDIPIYTHNFNNLKDFIVQMFNVGIESIFRLKTILDENTNDVKESSNFQILRNIIILRNEYNLSKKEFKILLSFI